MRGGYRPCSRGSWCWPPKPWSSTGCPPRWTTRPLRPDHGSRRSRPPAGGSTEERLVVACAAAAAGDHLPDLLHTPPASLDLPLRTSSTSPSVPLLPPSERASRELARGTPGVAASNRSGVEGQGSGGGGCLPAEAEAGDEVEEEERRRAGWGGGGPGRGGGGCKEERGRRWLRTCGGGAGLGSRREGGGGSGEEGGRRQIR
nr:uncharacterized protein LOC127329183 [Lolium perenne]